MIGGHFAGRFDCANGDVMTCSIHDRPTLFKILKEKSS